jgi:hypothetical protein
MVRFKHLYYWTNQPKGNKSTEQTLKDYVDSFISCSFWLFGLNLFGGVFFPILTILTGCFGSVQACKLRSWLVKPSTSIHKAMSHISCL